jgi:hypothetical protein
MSILETFYILFKGDNTDLKKSAKESERAVENLSGTLKNTFEKVDLQTSKVNKSFYELAKAAAAFVGASAAAYTVFHKTLAASQYAGELGNISKALGVNASELDAWSNAVQRTGGSAAGFQQSLNGIAKHFGVSAGIALKTLPQLADAFKRLGNFRAQYYGKLLGIDEATILLLQQGRREVEAVIARQKELGAVTEKDIEIANKYKIANLELSLAFRSLYLSLAQDVVPILTKAYEKLVPVIQYIRDHKDLVIGAFIGIGIAAAVMLAPFIAANAAIIGVGVAIATVIGLFAIAYEDIKAYIEGNQSLTGDLLKRWTNVKNLFHDVLEVLKKIFQYSSIPGLSTAISLAQNASGKIVEYATPYLQSISPFYNKSFDNNATINGDIIINTQATDANGIAAEINKGILSHFWHSNNQFADGAQY